MNYLTAKIIGFLTLMTCATLAQAQTLSFSDQTAFPQAYIVNDSVMGGVSRSGLETEGLFNRFSGNVSLDNNGGFASVRFFPAQPLPNAQKVVLRAKGDGRTYQLRFRMEGNWRAVAYSIQFETLKDTWQTFEFNVDEFKPVWRGRNVSNAPPLSFDKAEQISLFIADKQQGGFKLLLDSLTLLGQR